MHETTIDSAENLIVRLLVTAQMFPKHLQSLKGYGIYLLDAPACITEPMEKISKNITVAFQCLYIFFSFLH